MHWFPTSSLNNYSCFYRWINGIWVPMEIFTLAIGCLVLYIIRFPFMTVLIYFTLTFMSMDAIHLFANLKSDPWPYYCIDSITIGILLNLLAFVLYRKDQKEFGFWGYLFGMFLCWSGLTGWNMQTEWGYFTYFLINCMFILLSSFFHRKIFMSFGSLGVIYYIGHLAYIFSDSLLFSYILAGMGFSIIMLVIFLTPSRKKHLYSSLSTR
jgi:hypothetical protein